MGFKRTAEELGGFIAKELEKLFSEGEEEVKGEKYSLIHGDSWLAKCVFTLFASRIK